MFSSFTKKLFRDLLAHATQAAAVVVIVALGILLFCGLLLSRSQLRRSADDVFKRTRYEDFSAEVGSAPPQTVGRISGLPNVAAAEGRLTSPVS